MTWTIENDKAAQLTELNPGTSPLGKTFVPSSMISQVLTWLHSAKFAILSSGGTRMLHLIKEYFWWPNMTKDVKEFVAACHTCARNKNCNKPPAGLLPLPAPYCPWSHIALDFFW